MNPRQSKVTIGPPTELTRTFAQRILGYGVWFVVGLSPLLGRLSVPGFSKLIDLYPAELQFTLIPLSGVLMSMMAVTVEFAESSKVGRRKLTQWFGRTVAIFLVSFLLLLAFYLFQVTRIEGADGTHAMTTGGQTVPRQLPGSKCKCLEGSSSADCIEGITLNPANIKQCFGATRIAFSDVVLAILYLLVTGSFVAAIGLLLLFQRSRRAGTAV